MKGFAFRLQPVLDLRCQELERAQQYLAQCLQHRQAIAQQISACDEAVSRLFEQHQRTLGQGHLAAETAANFSELLQRLRQQRARFVAAMAQHDSVVVQAREALQAALVRKKALEVLKTKQETGHRKHVEKQSQHQLDDWIQQRHARRQQTVT